MRISVSVETRRARKNFRQLVDEALSRARAGLPPRRIEGLPRTSNLGKSADAQAIMTGFEEAPPPSGSLAPDRS
ncbi:hypothetical protein [Jiella sonneratiae]|uniref:Antitoxin n=1 Tax=Jiella sonneratiae TaxID=2816856 RepID=A0ABS3J5H8_9HYPH|nr:hypothetical protein [Jiella sonneratiae]MBO0904918.1 hypothetical protein [Jiella sonneratiae]